MRIPSLKSIKSNEVFQICSFLASREFDFGLKGKPNVGDADPLYNAYSAIETVVKLEKFLFLGVVACIDLFLYYVTFWPLKVVCWAVHLVRSRSVPLRADQVDDIVKFIILSLTIPLLYFSGCTEYSDAYHFVKRESALKLYVIFSMLEVFDKLLSAFGQDVLDQVVISCMYKGNHSDLFRWSRVIIYILFTCIYVSFHSLVIFFQVVTLNVAINSENNALITLLISNNFVELKTNVFKRFGKDNLFQISCADVVERYQILLYCIIMILQNFRGLSFGGAKAAHLFLLWSCEYIVDWIKHCFVMKFNSLSNDAYEQYETVIATDIISEYENQSKMRITRRLGFVILPSFAILVRFVHQSIKDLPGESRWLKISCFLVIVLNLWLLKALCSIILIGRSTEVLNRNPRHKEKEPKPEEVYHQRKVEKWGLPTPLTDNISPLKINTPNSAQRAFFPYPLSDGGRVPDTSQHDEKLESPPKAPNAPFDEGEPTSNEKTPSKASYPLQQVAVWQLPPRRALSTENTKPPEKEQRKPVDLFSTARWQMHGNNVW